MIPMQVRQDQHPYIFRLDALRPELIDDVLAGLLDTFVMPLGGTLAVTHTRINKDRILSPLY